MEQNCRTILVLPIERFNLLAFTGAIDTMGIANTLLGYEAYRWVIGSTEVKPVYTHNHVAILPEVSLSGAPPVDRVLVCASYGVDQYSDDRVLGYIRHQHRKGVEIGSLGMGVFILARAGILNGRRCAVHWENEAPFRDQFPELNVTKSLFEIDGNVFTCCGAETSIDLMVALIAKDHGTWIVPELCAILIHERARDPSEQRYHYENVMMHHASPLLHEAVQIMADHIEVPISIEKIVREIGCSKRQLQRHFLDYFGCSPKQYYLNMRLDKARTLLIQSRQPITPIALACGFASHGQLSTAYRKRFGISPSQERPAKRKAYGS